MRGDNQKNFSAAIATLSTAADLHAQHAAFRARLEKYRREGYDRLAAAQFVATAGGRLSEPVLDVGTGHGLLAIALAQQGVEVISVDVDRDGQALAALLAQEAKVAKRIHLVHADGACLSYPDAHFGTVAMMSVLHHLEKPLPILREMARVLRPGGMIILADFTDDGFEVIARIHEQEGKEHPRTATTIETALNFLTDNGFRCASLIQGQLNRVAVLQKSSSRLGHD